MAGTYPRLPLGGHLQAKEKGEDLKPPGERQWKLNLVRWVCHGERHRQLRKTRPGGKETLLRPYAPLDAIRTNDDADDHKLLRVVLSYDNSIVSLLHFRNDQYLVVSEMQ